MGRKFSWVIFVPIPQREFIVHNKLHNTRNSIEFTRGSSNECLCVSVSSIQMSSSVDSFSMWFKESIKVFVTLKQFNYIVTHENSTETATDSDYSDVANDRSSQIVSKWVENEEIIHSYCSSQMLVIEFSYLGNQRKRTNQIIMMIK